LYDIIPAFVATQTLEYVLLSHPQTGLYSLVQGPSVIKLSSTQVISLLQEIKKNDIKIKNIVILVDFIVCNFIKYFKYFKKQ